MKDKRTNLNCEKDIPLSEFYMKNQDEISSILNCVEDGIFVVDENAVVIALNEASLRLTKLNREELIGHSMYELIETGKLDGDETTSILALEQKKAATMLQKNVNGEMSIIATATPYFQDGEIKKVVVTERDISQLLALERRIQQEKEKTKTYGMEIEYLKKQDILSTGSIVARSVKMIHTVNTALKVAKIDVPVLLQGESGTGKEVIAKFIYQNSLRKDKPFLEINCAAIPETLIESELFGYDPGAFTDAHKSGKRGIFEMADGGTLLLDEIDTLPVHLQPKLLRVLQENEVFRIGGDRNIPVDVRIIASTNANLIRLVDEGLFRKDLYYRLNVVPITIAPLRERRDDIIPLAHSFLKRNNEKYGMNKSLSLAAERVMLSYNWPGNVRELQNFMERLTVAADSDVIDEKNLTEFLGITSDNPAVLDFSDNQSLGRRMAEFEKYVIEEAMKLCDRRQDLADMLQIDRSTLTRKMNRYGIDNKWK